MASTFITQLMDATVPNTTASRARPKSLLEQEKTAYFERRQKAKDFITRQQAGLAAKASFAHIPAKYFDPLPLKPGLNSWMLLAKLVKHKTIKLHLRIPETVVVDGSDFMWLQTGNKGNVRRKSIAGEWYPKYIASLWPERQTTPGLAGTEPTLDVVAVVKTPHYKDPRQNLCAPLQRREVLDRLKNSTSPMVMQSFVVAKGNKAGVYRVIWRPGKPVTAYNLMNRVLFDGSADMIDPHSDASERADPLAALFKQPAPKSEGTSSSASVSSTQRTQKLSMEQQQRHTIACCASSDNPSVVELISVSGRAMEGVDVHINELVAFFEKLLSTPSVRWKFTEFVADFIKDDANQWTFLQVKSYTLDDACYAAFCRGPASDDEEEQGPVRIQHPEIGRRCWFCRIIYLPDEMMTVSLPKSALALEQTIHDTLGQYINPEQQSLDLGADGAGDVAVLKDVIRVGGIPIREFDAGHQLNMSNLNVKVFGYTLTKHMMQETVELLERTRRLPDFFQHVAASSASQPQVSNYQQHAVCRLCFEIYQAQLELRKVADEFARCLGAPISDYVAPVVPTQRLLATATPRLPERLHIPPTQRLHHWKLHRVPTCELPSSVNQYRMVIMLRHIEDLPIRNDLPRELERCEIQYCVFEHTYRVPVSLISVTKLQPLNHLRAHYFMATGSGLQDFLSNATIELRIVRPPIGASDRSRAPGDGDVEGICVLHLTKFLSSGRKLTQMKQDLVLPFQSEHLGSLGLALSVGFVRDQNAVMATQRVLTSNRELFWPDEDYYDYLPLPQAWSGVILGGSGIGAVTQVQEEIRRLTRHAESMRNPDASTVSPTARSPGAVIEEGDGHSSTSSDHESVTEYEDEKSPDFQHASTPVSLGSKDRARSPVVLADMADGSDGYASSDRASPSASPDSADQAWTAKVQQSFLRKQTQSTEPSEKLVLKIKRGRITSDSQRQLETADIASSPITTPLVSVAAPAPAAVPAPAPASAPGKALGGKLSALSRGTSSWKLLAGHIRAGHVTGTASAPNLATSVKHILHGHAWLEAAIAIASSLGGTTNMSADEVQWTQLQAALCRADVVKEQESVIRIGRREKIFRTIFQAVDTEGLALLDLAECRSFFAACAAPIREPIKVIVSQMAGATFDEVVTNHVAAWLAASQTFQQRFALYDHNGSGLISFAEFSEMAQAAYREACKTGTHPGQMRGRCELHGDTFVYRADLFCTQCEVIAFATQREFVQSNHTNWTNDPIGTTSLVPKEWLKMFAANTAAAERAPSPPAAAAATGSSADLKSVRSKPELIKRKSSMRLVQQAAANRLSTGKSSNNLSRSNSTTRSSFSLQRGTGAAGSIRNLNA